MPTKNNTLQSPYTEKLIDPYLSSLNCLYNNLALDANLLIHATYNLMSNPLFDDNQENFLDLLAPCSVKRVANDIDFFKTDLELYYPQTFHSDILTYSIIDEITINNRADRDVLIDQFILHRIETELNLIHNLLVNLFFNIRITNIRYFSDGILNAVEDEEGLHQIDEDEDEDELEADESKIENNKFLIKKQNTKSITDMLNEITASFCRILFKSWNNESEIEKIRLLLNKYFPDNDFLSEISIVNSKYGWIATENQKLEKACDDKYVVKLACIENALYISLHVLVLLYNASPALFSPNYTWRKGILQTCEVMSPNKKGWMFGDSIYECRDRIKTNVFKIYDLLKCGSSSIQIREVLHILKYKMRKNFLAYSLAPQKD